jgi:CRP-like cAMP-binding protein
MQQICSSRLFAGLSEREHFEITTCAHVRTFAKNEPLFIQGHPVESLILIESGTVKQTQAGRNGNEVLIRISKEGDVVNLRAESARAGYTCSAHAMEQCRALIWDYSHIREYMSRPVMRRNISRILADELGELEERYREMATEKVSKRLSLLMIRLAEKIGHPSGKGMKVSLSREELAQMTGSTAFTISRVLSEWSSKGLVVSLRESVIVTDPGQLELMD